MIQLTCINCNSQSFTVENVDYTTEHGIVNAECYQCLKCNETLMDGEQMNRFRKKINDRKTNECNTAKTSDRDNTTTTTSSAE